MFYTRKKVLKRPVPEHLAIILDGNGRWAKKRGLPRTIGHFFGARNLVNLAKECDSLGIKTLTVYAFSTENWNRPKDEVNYLMTKPVEEVQKNMDKIRSGNIRIRFIGRRDRVFPETLNTMIELEKATYDKRGLNLVIAFDYGSRNEIVESFKKIHKKIINQELTIEDISENTINSFLYTKDFKDVDLLIRTSGEKRLSNFLLWQLSYSEFYFTRVHFPAFHTKRLYKAIISYQNRDRRYGGLKEKK